MRGNGKKTRRQRKALTKPVKGEIPQNILGEGKAKPNQAELELQGTPQVTGSGIWSSCNRQREITE